MPHLTHQVLQASQTTPESRLFRAYPYLEIAFLVTRAVQGEAQKVNRLWTPLPVLACVPLGKTTKCNELGFSRFERQTKFLQSFAQGILNTKCIRLILETHHKVVNIASAPDRPRPAGGALPLQLGVV